MMYTKLNETIKLMNSDDFKERFKAEYYQVKIRAKNLEKMLAQYKNGTLSFTPNCSYEILYEQLIFMRHYMGILIRRAYIEGIELGDEYGSGCCCCEVDRQPIIKN